MTLPKGLRPRSIFLSLVLSVLFVQSPAAAENVKIGLPSVTITAMPFFVAKEHGFFQQEGLNAEMVVMPASLNIKVLLAGEIQYAATIGSAVAAALLSPPYNFLAYREGLKNLGFAGNFVRLPSTGIATLGETLERSPDQVRRLTRAIARARAFAKENKARIMPTLKRALRIDDEDLIGKNYDQHKQVETADGRVDSTLIADTIRDARQTEGITKEIPANQVFDFSYLPAR